MSELGEPLALELADTLACEPELASDRLERLLLAVEPEAELEDSALPVRKPAQSRPNGVAAQGLTRLFGGIRRGRIREQIAELAASVFADGQD